QQPDKDDSEDEGYDAAALIGLIDCHVSRATNEKRVGTFITKSCIREKNVDGMGCRGAAGKCWTLPTTCKRMARLLRSETRGTKMNSAIRMVACIFFLLVLAAQHLPHAQQPKESGSSTPQASPSPAPSPGPGGTSLPNANPFPSTYKPFPGRPTIIRNA